VIPASPAFAATPPEPWIGNPAGSSNVGSFGSIFTDPGDQQLQLAFGTRGTDPSPEATISLPSYPGPSLPTDNPPCSKVGAAVRCAGPAGADGVMFGWAFMSATASTPLGYAGLITVSTPSGATATIPLWITSHTQGADLEVRTTSATGKVGDTIPVT